MKVPMTDLKADPLETKPEQAQLAGIEDEVAAIPAEYLAERAVHEFWLSETSTWRAAIMLRRVKAEELFDGYKTFQAWSDARFGTARRSRTAKMALAAEALEKLPPETREEAKTTPPLTFYESRLGVLAKKDPQEAARLAASGASQRELKNAVATRTADEQHYDTEDLRTFSLTLRASQHAKLMALLHWIRFQMPQPHPSGPELFDAIEADIADLVAIYWGRQQPPAKRFPLADILAGHVRCIETGATNSIDLHGHHTILRSVKGKDQHGRYDGSDSPQVWLSSEIHDVVHRDYKIGNWRSWVERWLARKDLGWLRERMAAWLGPRKLEEIGR